MKQHKKAKNKNPKTNEISTPIGRCDIVVPVYNSPRQVRACLESLQRFIDFSMDRIIVVNDCSDEFTTGYLRSLGYIDLMENDKNKGFLGSANKGMLAGRAKYVCLLNSDTVIADSKWLDKMIQYADQHPDVGLITPLSNEGVNLSLKLHPGADIHLMSKIVNTTTMKKYPDAVTIVGFCMLIRTALIREIGGFDPVFGRGYCEESDYHYRALQAGFKCKVSDEVFVYHEGEASFSGQRDARYPKNRQIFDQRWGRQYEADIVQFNEKNVLGYLRNDQFFSLLPQPHDPYDILFVLPSLETYGGVIVVIDLVNELIRMGMKANIVCLSQAKKIVDVSRYFEPLVIAEKDFPELVPRAHVYAATHYHTAFPVFDVVHHYGAKALYLVQDDERLFENVDTALVEASFRLIPNHIYVAQWLADSIGTYATFKRVINNGIYRDLFYPKEIPLLEKKQLQVSMMTRKDVKRGFYEGISAINRLLAENPSAAGRMHFHFFGNRTVFAHEINTDMFTNHGIVSRSNAANILQQSDILIDPSHFQGFGLTALEAMSSGCAVILPDKGGGDDFARPFENALFFRAKDVNHLHEMLNLLITSPSLRVKLQKNAVELPDHFSIYHSVIQFQNILENQAQLADVPSRNTIEYLQYQLQLAETNRFKYFQTQIQMENLAYENKRLRERLHYYMAKCRTEVMDE